MGSGSNSQVFGQKIYLNCRQKIECFYYLVRDHKSNYKVNVNTFMKQRKKKVNVNTPIDQSDN